MDMLKESHPMKYQRVTSRCERQLH